MDFFHISHEILSTVEYSYLRKLPAYRLIEIRKRIEQALKEAWNEMADKAVFILEDGTDAGEFYAAKIRELKEKI